VPPPAAVSPSASPTATGLAADPKPTIIDPSTGWVPLRLGELVAYRELVYFLVWRDVKVRYKQTALGVAWAVLQPLLAMFVFSLFFGRLAGMASDGLPYPVFNLAGLVPWTFFVFGLTEAANSLVGSRQLITKVYFPRLAVPLAPVLAGLVDFAIAFVLLLVVMAWYGIVPGVGVLAVVPLDPARLRDGARRGPLARGAQRAIPRRALRPAVPLAALAVRHADRLSQQPRADAVAHGVRGEPDGRVVDGFRWALLGTAPPGMTIVVSAAAAVAIAIGGAFYFRRMERGFADIV
jgi:lipopolysaccharide transport system permease protein